MDLAALGPDDALVADWCGVWSACSLADRPDEQPRTVEDHAALGRQLVAPGGSRDGSHRAAVVGGAVVGALRTIVPLQDNLATAVLDVAVHPHHRRRGLGTALLEAGCGSPARPAAPACSPRSTSPVRARPAGRSRCTTGGAATSPRPVATCCCRSTARGSRRSRPTPASAAAATSS